MSISPLNFTSAIYNKSAQTSLTKQNNNSSNVISNFGMKNNLQHDTFEKSSDNMKKTPSGQQVSKEDYTKLKSRHDEVKKHEEAHQAAGGSLASNPVYEYNDYGYIQNGHVNIEVPKVNKADPQKSKQQAETVKQSALAPQSFSELSDADLNVAAKAEDVIQKSQDLINKKNNS